jgi:HlyD family secretion protein
MKDQQEIGRAQEQSEHSHTVTAAPARPRPLARRLAILFLVLVIATAALLIWKLFFAGPRSPDSVISLSGRIEGDDSAVAPKTSGRILELRVREGDKVKAGDTIATLDDQQIRAREEQAQAALSQADAKVRWAQDQISILQEQLRQSQLRTEQARLDASGRVRQADADLAGAEAELARQEASYRLASFDKEAYTRLAETGAVAERKGKEATSNAAQQAAAVAAARRHVEALRGALTVAKANLENPGIRGSQAAVVRNQIQQQQAEIARAVAASTQARAQLSEAQANRRDLVVTAPFDGTVMTRAAEPGEVVTAGTSIVTLLDLSKMYLKGYVPEGQIGNIQIGQPARIYLDSNPDRPIDAYVSRVDPEATFTPENTYFRDERVKQVVGVKLQLKDSAGNAKPGMPADGEVLVQGDAWPQGKRMK